MPKTWKLKPEVPDDVQNKIMGTLNKVRPFAHNLEAGTASEGFYMLAQLLYNRGLTEQEEIEGFLDPKYENLHSPFLFADMHKAANRIWKAIDDGEAICIYGDYDADAVTANAVLQQAFRYLGVCVQSYIPDRFTEGYGINMEALSKIKENGAKIIITVDCGTNSVDAAEFCLLNQIDLIITDHHEIIGPLPKAFALINPKNHADNYPYSEITGVGVAFKLACGILSDQEKTEARYIKQSALAQGPRVKGYEKWLLDLVAIGTVADCHSLLGENRILVKYGLKVLAKTRWAGLKALVLTAGLDFAVKPPDTYSLGFNIAPRLNAAGRLEHADLALHLLMEQNFEKALLRAAELEAVNKRRQDQTLRILSEAKEQAERIRERKVIVLSGEGWSKGVVGLVAGRLADEFYKPVIVLEKEQEFSTGSARTSGEFDILEALKYSSAHLVRFGGHKQAAGLTIKSDKFNIFYQTILEYAESRNLAESSQRVLELEGVLGQSQLMFKNLKMLELLEPFGVDNLKPKFLINGLKIESLRAVGANKQHLQLQLSALLEGSAEKSNQSGEILNAESGPDFIKYESGSDVSKQKGNRCMISAIYFNCGDFAKQLKPGDIVDAAAELIEEGWNGRKEMKLKIIDLKQFKS
jgi:single-stranded-DNA-specific exonuclease